jgi:hypothetical protein
LAHLETLFDAHPQMQETYQDAVTRNDTEVFNQYREQAGLHHVPEKGKEHVQGLPGQAPRLPHLPVCYLVFTQEPESGEVMFEEAGKSKGLPRDLYGRLVKMVIAWKDPQGLLTSRVGGRKPVVHGTWAQVSLGAQHRFVLELLEKEQLIRVQLLIENPTMVVEVLQNMVGSLTKDHGVSWFVALKPSLPGASNSLVSLCRVQEALGPFTDGSEELWVGSGMEQYCTSAAHFPHWIPPLHEESYDIHLSYRQQSDNEFARMIFDALSRLVVGPNGRRLRVYMDRARMVDGASWKEAFVQGLLSSEMLVPIVSKGCLEPMSQMHPAKGQDWCDNILLEWKLGLEAIKLAEYPMSAIFPVMVGSLDGDGQMMDFFLESASIRLADAPSGATDAELRRILPHVETIGLSVASTKQSILEYLGVQAWKSKSTHNIDPGHGIHDIDIPAGCAYQMLQILAARVAAQSREALRNSSTESARGEMTLRLDVSGTPKTKIVIVSGPEYGPDGNGGYTFPVIESNIALAKREKGVLLAFEWAGSSNAFQEDASVWEDYKNAASEEEREILVNQTRWFAAYCAQVKGAVSSACQEGFHVVMACIAGGPVSQSEARKIPLIREQVITDLARLSYTDVVIEIQTFDTYQDLEIFCVKNRMVE